MTKETALQVSEASKFLIVSNPKASEMLDAAIELGLNDYEFPHIKVPSGGGMAFEVTLGDGTEIAKSLDVIIATYKANQRAFYFKEFGDGEPTPPDCSSDDGVQGYGVIKPGADPEIRSCTGCPMNEWGSASKPGKEKRGKACAEKTDIFAFLPGEALPVRISAPPTSLKPLKVYAVGQMSKLRALTDIVTTLSLHKEKGPPEYSVIDFTFKSALSDEEAKRIKAMGRALEEHFPKRTAEDLAKKDGVTPREVGEEPSEEAAENWTEGAE